MESKRCPKCEVIKPITEFWSSKRDGYHSWCKVCSTTYQREHRRSPECKARANKAYQRLQAQGYFVKRWKEYSQRPEVKQARLERLKQYRQDPRVRIKNLARWYTNHLIRDGKLNREPCALCGQEQSEAHHLDYNQPLLIAWLCPDCHRKVHLKAKYLGKVKE